MVTWNDNIALPRMKKPLIVVKNPKLPSPGFSPAARYISRCIRTNGFKAWQRSVSVEGDMYIRQFAVASNARLANFASINCFWPAVCFSRRMRSEKATRERSMAWFPDRTERSRLRIVPRLLAASVANCILKLAVSFYPRAVNCSLFSRTNWPTDQL